MTINGPAPIVPSVSVQNVQNLRATQSSPAAPEAASEVKPPAGVDAELWQLLTPDEQSFFANQSVLGPLTYGPVQEVSAADAPRGQRIDVRA